MSKLAALVVDDAWEIMELVPESVEVEDFDEIDLDFSEPRVDLTEFLSKMNNASGSGISSFS